jgi:hypothetical protein
VHLGKEGNKINLKIGENYKESSVAIVFKDNEGVDVKNNFLSEKKQN